MAGDEKTQREDQDREEAWRNAEEALRRAEETVRRAVETGPSPVGLANVQLEVERIWSDLNTVDLSQTAAADRLAHERRRLDSLREILPPRVEPESDAAGGSGGAELGEAQAVNERHDQTRRSRTDLALAVSVAGGVIGLLAIFAAGFFAGYVELAGINRELGGVLVKHDDIERRLIRLEEGQDHIRATLAQMIGRFDALDARLGTIEQTVRGMQDRAALEP